MEVKAGRYYRNRSGAIVGPILSSRRMPDDVPFVCDGIEYERNGQARVVFNMLPALDLVDEVPAAAVAAVRAAIAAVLNRPQAAMMERSDGAGAARFGPRKGGVSAKGHYCGCVR